MWYRKRKVHEKTKPTHLPVPPLLVVVSLHGHHLLPQGRLPGAALRRPPPQDITFRRQHFHVVSDPPHLTLVPAGGHLIRAQRVLLPATQVRGSLRLEMWLR